MPLNQLDSEWEIDDNIIHLNHAAVAPWPKRTQRAIEQFVAENVHIGSKNYLQWIAKETALRDKLKQLINAPSIDDIALLKNTSEGLSLIAYGLDWQKGDNIVISNEEFPSNRIVWESLRKRFGVEVRYADLTLTNSPEQSLINLCDHNTKLLSISSVQYASGLRMDLELLGAQCREKEILFCIDAIQSLGALEFDVVANQADFVVADAHKWMMGPEGIALFYTNADSRKRLKLLQYGWHMVENMGDFSDTHWSPAQSARRFECGSPNMLGIHAFDASLSLILELGIPYIESEIRKRVEYLIEAIQQDPGLALLSTTNMQRQSGIICFKKADQAPELLYNFLQEHGVLCALRGGGIRFSPHYYTPLEKVKQALNLAAKVYKE